MQETAPVVRLDDTDDLDDLLDREDRVLLDLYTSGCTLCNAIEPVLGNVARARDDVTVAMANAGDDLDFVDRYDVRSVPTLVLIEDGDVVATLAEGFQGGHAIEAFLDEN
ncbi:thiol reductase thioredoxin [Halarchaeum grantii]|uniref:Thiol reductase thioredoxin n=1 Tax=Halarchaeum grantii TaxID=1193105 RepID=A0A830EYD4_9EURY|nr:thioredoxin family protein [Halarchaeum grantii]GGL36983.1 thiol reductase thioredoxin [Halarchaeum grantii]